MRLHFISVTTTCLLTLQAMNQKLLKYLSPKNYVKRVLHVGNLSLIQKGESLFAPDPNLPIEQPPIFVLGAPRCGSTLTIQVLTDILDLGYISNCSCRWFGAPALAERFCLCKRRELKQSSNYVSSYGYTEGSYAPAECGQWWYRFFQHDPPYIKLSETNQQRMIAFRRSVAALTKTLNKSILFKNLYASLRIQAIAKYIPESLFIVIHRNEVDIGHSLLEARYKFFKNYDSWFSVEPPGVEQLKKLPSYIQVIEQVRAIYRIIDYDLEVANFDVHRRFDMTYEDFCQNPGKVVNQLLSFLSVNSCKVSLKKSPPNAFMPRGDIRIDPELYKLMVSYVEQSNQTL